MFIGLDVIAVRLLAALLKQVASEVMEMVSRISSQLGNTQWIGNDRQQFESNWDNEYKVTLTNISNSLEQFAGVAEKNAADQEAASSC